MWSGVGFCAHMGSNTSGFKVKPGPVRQKHWQHLLLHLFFKFNNVRLLALDAEVAGDVVLVSGAILLRTAPGPIFDWILC